MGVATSTQTEQACSQLERGGLLPHLKCVIGGDLVEKHKPNPEVYHKVAELLGVKAFDCVAFEDSETGTRAAVSSGAQTIQVPDLIPPSDDLVKLGHVIAFNLLEGALNIGLITNSDIWNCGMQTTLHPQFGRLLLLGVRSSSMFIELVSGEAFLPLTRETRIDPAVTRTPTPIRTKDAIIINAAGRPLMPPPLYPA